MFAHAVYVDVPDDDYFLMRIGREHCVVYHLLGCLAISLGHKQQRFGPTLGSLQKSFPIGIFAYTFKDRVARISHFLETFGLLFFRVDLMANTGRSYCFGRKVCAFPLALFVMFFAEPA